MAQMYGYAYKSELSVPSQHSFIVLSEQNPASFPTADSMYGVGSETIRYTPRTLGWTHGTELLKLYSFVVPKGKEPYFELQGWTPTTETPSKVYLDTPVYAAESAR
jgi:hypothetical protein